MLEITLSSTFIPGANRRGEVAGASWLFLLPALPLECTVCLGVPPRTTLSSLARFNRSVVVLTANRRRVGKAKAASGWANIRWYTSAEVEAFPLEVQSVDLLLVADWYEAWRLRRDPELQQKLLDLMKPEASIYSEYLLPSGLLDSRSRMTPALPDAGARLRLWLTPFTGEAASMAPLDDAKTLNYLLDHALYSTSLQVGQTAKRLVRAASRRIRQSRPSAPHSGEPVADSGDLPMGGSRSSSWLAMLDRAGAAVEADSLRRGLARRSAVLAGSAAAGLAVQPPQYLCDVAREAGISLDHYNWGFVAPADYSSRKLLFLLFNRRLGESGPQLIVKMVRDPLYNHRLENERQALLALHELDGLDLSAVPRVVFAGYHAGMALVGESVINGVSFRERTRHGAGDTHLRTALTWLTDLASTTCNERVQVGHVADSLEKLLVRFLEIYRMSPQHRSFLAEQLEEIAASRITVPLVFQHGDPGLWNLLVTPSGHVAFLDWEAAEQRGAPLWDLLYLLRSYCVSSARSHGIRNALAAYRQGFLADGPLRRLGATFIAKYCDQIRLPHHLVEPLFYFCWMHRALKEAHRLAPAKVEQGHYVNLLRMCIEQRKAVASTLHACG